MTSSALTQLIQLASDRKGVYLRTACDESEVARYRLRAIAELGDDLPDGYLDLLRISNGVQINNAQIESVESLLESNLELRQSDSCYAKYIFIGYQGNMEKYLFNKSNRKYEMVNFFSPEHVFEQFNSFEYFLRAILSSQFA